MGGHTTNAALFAVLCLFLGSSYAWTKLGLEGLDPLTFVLSRLLIGVGVLGLWLRLSGEGVPRERGLYALGLLNVLGAFLLLTWGQQYVESSHAAILVASGPIFSALGATYVLPDERLDRRRAAGVALGFVGVIALFSGDLGGSSTTRTGHEIAGAVAIVVSAVVIAAIAIVVRLRFPGYSAVQIALPQVTGGLAAVTVVSLLAGAGGLVTFEADLLAPWVLISVLCLGVFNAGLGNIVYYRLVLGWGVTRTALVAYVAPFIGAAIGVGLLDEHLGPNAAVGLALTLASLALVTRDLEEVPCRNPR